jgi:LDH2 family malate/lactate/ureidoglycolate dehydrogenase
MLPTRVDSTLSIFASSLSRRVSSRAMQLMNEADLTGADAHGIFRLPQYVRRIRAGGVNTMPRISVQKRAGATALVDGDNGMGHLVVSRAAETAIALASDAGIGWVGVRRSNHAGTAGLYAAIPVAYGMIGLYAAVANANHMAVRGGSEPLLGTNPLGIGLPSDSGPVVLDMATVIPENNSPEREDGPRRLTRIRILTNVQRDEFSLCTPKFESDMLSHAVGLNGVRRPMSARSNAHGP